MILPISAKLLFSVRAFQSQHAAQMLNVSDCLYYSYLSPICTGRQSVASTVYIAMVINDNIYVQK